MSVQSNSPDQAWSSDLRGQRVLAAIVLTDVVGFSALMSEAEEETLTLVDTDLSLMGVLCQQHDGRVIKSTGDGLLMYFTSAIKAVDCAITIQQHMISYAEGKQPSAALSHRIGIHLGEVFLSKTDVMGNAVNIAARLEGLAQPAGICLSQAVYEVVRSKLPFEATCLGFQKLKNIREPVLVYHLLGTSRSPERLDTVEPNQQALSAVSPTNPCSFAKPEIVPPHLTQQNYRDRLVLLNKVRNFWLKGLLESSLHGKVVLELGLQERPDAVENPWRLTWQAEDAIHHQLQSDTQAINLFDELGTGATLLILGAPGSGKTTTLLQLTQALLNRAEQDQSYALPIVFNLSSWEGRSLADWLIKELNNKYQLPQNLGKPWIEHQELTLMLDGLDEVAEHRRDACVQAINQFSKNHRYTEIVVCSRIKDYEVLTNRLQFQGAIFIQPLTTEQIQTYLEQAGPALAGVRGVLPTAPQLQELARSPLMLNMMTIAYHGLSVTELQQLTLRENQAQPLLEVYIERMLNQSSKRQHYKKSQTKQWLHWLALKMFLNAQSIFLIEQLQISLVERPWQIWLYRWGVGLALGSVYGFLFGFAYRSVITLPFSGAISLPAWFEFGFFEELFWRLDFSHHLLHHLLALKMGPIVGMSLGLLGTLPAALFGSLDQIKPVENMEWSWRRAGLILLGGIIIGFGFRVSVDGGLGFIVGLVGSLLWSFGWVRANVQSKTIPNESIWRSVANASYLLLVLDISILLGILQFANPYFQNQFMTEIGLSTSIGLVFILRSQPVSAGVALIQHLVLRTVLWLGGYTPRNYARFLNYATRSSLMQRVGSGYVFLHRLLLEHLALMNTDEKPLS